MSGHSGDFVRAIQAIYEEEVTAEDRSKAVDVSIGETATLSPEQLVPTAKVLGEDHRFEALKFIYKNWERVEGELFDETVPMLLIEMYELHRLWRSREEHTCIMRACSFFQSYLYKQVDVSPETGLAGIIDSAASNDVITTDEQKLYHFVREVRNECGHNAWLDLDYPREHLVFACTTSNFLLQELADRKLTEMGAESMDGEAEAAHFVRKAEEDFQWTCTHEDGDINWEAPDSWEHPDREFSTYDDYWESLN
jgi:hypothetical protein